LVGVEDAEVVVVPGVFRFATFWVARYPGEWLLRELDGFVSGAEEGVVRVVGVVVERSFEE
jgi:hypothetical protein